MAAKRPPLGLMPQSIHEGKRIHQITQAMCRYSAEYKQIPIEWIIEVAFLNRKIKGDEA